MRFTSSQPENTDQRYGYTANQRFPVTLLRRKMLQDLLPLIRLLKWQTV